MRRMVQGFGLLLTTLLIASTALAKQDPVLVDRTRTRELLDDVLEDLARLEGLAEGKKHGDRMSRELASVRGKLKVLRDDIKRAPSARGLVSVGLVAEGEGVIL
ncbi:MAG: hypothetical protein ABIJ09_07410, partial [Pseudomonadota bacterium]